MQRDAVTATRGTETRVVWGGWTPALPGQKPTPVPPEQYPPRGEPFEFTPEIQEALDVLPKPPDEAL